MRHLRWPAGLLLLTCLPAALEAEQRWRRRRESSPLPEGVRVERDIAYGSHERQRFDVYAPEAASVAPVIFMVHGGGWVIGDKDVSRVVENKVARWVPRGLVFVSANYRLVPDADALAQADDVARALVRAQQEVARFGGDRERFVLMGHSAGAHLVSLLEADPERALRLGASPWLATVSLDSAALDVVRVMEGRHPGFYDQAFGSDPERWRAASPFHRLGPGPGAFLGVCAAGRRSSCDDAERFVERARERGRRCRVLPEDLTHGEVNELLGLDPRYTAEVEAFLAELDPALRRALGAGTGAAEPEAPGTVRRGRRVRRWR